MQVDTGANMMVISDELAKNLYSEGELTVLPNDMVTLLADGREVRQKHLLIHMVTLGRHTVHSIDGTIGSMLLPYQILNMFGRFTIDSNNGKLIFGG